MGIRRNQRKRPAAKATGLSRSAQLRKLDAIRAWAFLTRLDLKADALTARQRVEVDARVETGAVEEVLLPVLGGDEPEPAVGYQFLDCAGRHLQLLFSKVNLANARVLSRRIDDRGEQRSTSGRRNYLTTASPALNRAEGALARAPQRASKATPRRVATAPESLSAAACRSRSLHTPQTATATTAVSRTGATTESGAMLNAIKTSRYATHMNRPTTIAFRHATAVAASLSPSTPRPISTASSGAEPRAIG